MSTSILRALFLVFSAGLFQPVMAQKTAANPVAGNESSQSCVDVQANGVRSMAYNCFSKQLAPTPMHSARNHPDFPNPALASERAVRLSPNQNGLQTSIHAGIISGTRRKR
ncbi:Uncharacterised protein [Bordetella ansorpii]|uniref:Lipoprotein n=1 Tax=Bordetella ansorpii TaxID=288768 RepID=A0A157QUM0_9BORD|nr:hypothetical protein [Bordetella ansorpii]SAI49585.1 Uncharacterised protein [Bordetella ansorpii]